MQSAISNFTTKNSKISTGLTLKKFSSTAGPEAGGRSDALPPRHRPAKRGAKKRGSERGSEKNLHGKAKEEESDWE